MGKAPESMCSNLSGDIYLFLFHRRDCLIINDHLLAVLMLLRRYSNNYSFINIENS